MNSKLDYIFDLIKKNKLQEAKIICLDSIKLDNKNSEIFNIYAMVLFQLEEHNEALNNWKKAVELNPKYFYAYSNLGNAFLILKRYEEALKSYDEAIKIKPDHIAILKNKANILKGLKKLNESAEQWNSIIKINPSDINSYIEKAHIFFDLNRLVEALNVYMQAYLINPEHPFLLGHIVHVKSKICDWKDFSKYLKELEIHINNNKKVCTPFLALTHFDNPLLQKKVSETWVKEFTTTNALETLPNKNIKKKIKIGYYSSDLRKHAVGHLMVSMLELHDKSKFEIFGFYFGGELDEKDLLQKRIINSFDKFSNISLMSNTEVLKLSKDLNIDIAVDLMTHTGSINRFGIFMYHVAPIQVNFLGYPGTSGSTSIDYLIADKILIPEENKKFYSEKIVYLPNSYQPNEKNKEITEKKFTKLELGLPNKGFIFGCFNGHQKINPEIFDSWIKILNQNDDSIIWLLEDNQLSKENLKLEASSRGINPKRLIFAKMLPFKEHLERLKFVDLFLDTFPYNAHTTCSDALRMGIPVLTLKGQSFASRVAASLLTSVNLQELITLSNNEYERMAIKIMNEPKYLKNLKIILKENKSESTLFNCEAYTKNIETAYFDMYQKHINKA